MYANNIPEKLQFDLINCEIGDAIKISTIELPEDVKLTITDRDFVVATVVHQLLRLNQNLKQRLKELKKELKEKLKEKLKMKLKEKLKEKLKLKIKKKNHLKTSLSKQTKYQYTNIIITCG